ncbi:hypothetical protein [Modestobacter sp. NPDC049651]|uniref:hypothetical protein n=1 Tax=Modestobacter sp. NPDC049651 TaxID=3155777 RepID=UPI0033C454C9
MGWVLVVLVGLAAETALIVTLGRRVTGPWEREREGAPGGSGPAGGTWWEVTSQAGGGRAPQSTAPPVRRAA